MFPFHAWTGALLNTWLVRVVTLEPSLWGGCGPFEGRSTYAVKAAIPLPLHVIVKVPDATVWAPPK